MNILDQVRSPDSLRDGFDDVSGKTHAKRGLQSRFENLSLRLLRPLFQFAS